MRLYPFFTIVLALAPAVVFAQASQGLPVAKRWIVAAREHQPGTRDAPLHEISGWHTAEFEAVRRHLRDALRREFPTDGQRMDALRRGVLLHTDIAILAPDRAAEFTRLPEPDPFRSTRRPSETAPSTTIMLGVDGTFQGSIGMSAHWAFARMLVDALEPEPSGDPFAVGWYRAIAARFEAGYHLGHAMPHLVRARKILPHDPWILFYSGAMHEAFASPRFQNIARTGPSGQGQESPVRSLRAELRQAEEYLREALAVDPAFGEARLRHGRVLGLLGRHEEALNELRRAETSPADPVFRYFCQMFLGNALRALGRSAEARQAFDRAAALFPLAEAPSLARSELARRSGDRAAALDALKPLAARRDPDDPIDPWWMHLRSHARNASALMDAVRKPFLGEQP